MDNKTTLIPEKSIPAWQKGFPWQKGAIATVATLILLGVHLDANALALGAIQVKSALGEPLSAEVEVPDITAEEVSSFQAALASPQAFQAAGIDYSQALRGTRITLARRPNGQAYLRIQGQAPVNEPFIGLVIEANWAKGHVVRDYTLLIDPSPTPTTSAKQQPAQNTAPALPPPRQQPASNPAQQPPPAPSSSPSTALEPDHSGKSVFNTPGGNGGKVQVQPGDTAAGLAQDHLPDGVSLDQMLIAMLRANPQAFIHRNVNLIRAGAVLDMPGPDQATAVTPDAARRALNVQSRDFNAYRHGVASAVVSRGGSVASGHRRSASGSVQTRVQESNAAPPPPDRLTLSRANSAAGRVETRAAHTRQAQAQAARTEELNRNLQDLSKLASASGGGAAGGPAKSGKTVPAINIPSASGAVETSPSTTAAPETTPAASTPSVNTPPVTTPVASTLPVQPASAAAPKPHFAPPPPPPAGPSIFDSLLDSWPLIAGIVVVLAALAAYLGLRGKKRKTSNSLDETRIDSDGLFSDSKRAPDSFFGGEGGERVDTRDAAADDDGGSSMSYSHSQLEAAGDVDPVSEADVYLAYGRDAQAEEILKEALRTYPGRSPIYLKLAEIYAKRRDAHQLEAIATDAHRITRGEGNDWQAIVNLGHQLDPDNPLYQSGADNAADDIKTPSPAPYDEHDEAPSDASNTPVDLDLTDPMGLTPAAQRGPGAFTPAVSASRGNDRAAPPAPQYHKPVDFTPPPVQQDSGLMEFDMEPSPPAAPNTNSGALTQPAALGENDPLATKLALAQEFHTIGDDDSARSLVKEVLAEASGALKIKAAQLLSELG